MPLSKTELISKLLELNQTNQPFIVKQEGDTVVATWNLVDAQWLQLFAKAGMTETFKTTISFDEANHQVTMQDTSGSVKWEAGVPKISYSTSMFKGKKIEYKKSVAFGVKPDLSVGEIYNFDFNTNKIKDPILSVVTQVGWTNKRSFIQKLLGFK